jgi:hypothetical protein
VIDLDRVRLRGRLTVVAFGVFSTASINWIPSSSQSSDSRLFDIHAISQVNHWRGRVQTEEKKERRPPNKILIFCPAG